jgi:hypothetical protein
VRRKRKGPRKGPAMSCGDGHGLLHGECIRWVEQRSAVRAQTAYPRVYPKRSSSAALSRWILRSRKASHGRCTLGRRRHAECRDEMPGRRLFARRGHGMGIVVAEAETERCGERRLRNPCRDPWRDGCVYW